MELKDKLDKIITKEKHNNCTRFETRQNNYISNCKVCLRRLWRGEVYLRLISGITQIPVCINCLRKMGKKITEEDIKENKKIMTKSKKEYMDYQKMNKKKVDMSIKLYS